MKLLSINLYPQLASSLTSQPSPYAYTLNVLEKKRKIKNTCIAFRTSKPIPNPASHFSFALIFIISVYKLLPPFCFSFTWFSSLLNNKLNLKMGSNYKGHRFPSNVYECPHSIPVKHPSPTNRDALQLTIVKIKWERAGKRAADDEAGEKFGWKKNWKWIQYLMSMRWDWHKWFQFRKLTVVILDIIRSLFVCVCVKWMKRWEEDEQSRRTLDAQVYVCTISL